MAYEIDVFDHSLPAAVDLRTKQYFFVQVDSNGELALAGAGQRGYSLQDKPNAGEYGEFRVVGVAKITIGAAVTPDDLVTSDAAGKAVPAAVGQSINGQALTGASNDGEVISILVPAAGAAAP